MLKQQQLIWRCRRGVRELDVLLTRFVETEYPALSDADKANFEALLEIQDPVIMEWLFGKSTADEPGLNAIIQRLQQVSGF